MTQLIEEKAFDDNFDCNDVELRIKNEKDGTIGYPPHSSLLSLGDGHPHSKVPNHCSKAVVSLYQGGT